MTWSISTSAGRPEGREAGFRHPAIVVTAQRILEFDPSVVQAVPTTSQVRAFDSEVVIAADATNGLDQRSAAQCQHIRAVSTTRVLAVRGNVGSVALTQLRETLAVIIDLPS